MAKTKEPVITVSTIFAGRQTDRQAFIDLVIQKKENEKARFPLGITAPMRYNEPTPNCGIHSGMEAINED